LISIIIPTVKGDTKLKNCIKMIHASTFKNFEIIVVQQGLERSAQRNIGIDRSKGKLLLFLDSDQYVHRDLLNECWVLMEYLLFHLDALYIPEKILGDSFWCKVRNYERSFYNGTRIDAVRLVRKSLCPRFDEEMTGVEDWDFDRRFPGKKGIADSPIYHDEEDFNIFKYAKKKAYYSQWMGKYKDRYGNCPELNLWYRYFGVFFEYGKWKKVIRHPILYMGVLWLRLLVGIVYLTSKKCQK